MNPYLFRPIAMTPMPPYAFMRPPMAIPNAIPAAAQTSTLESFLSNASTLMNHAQKFTPYVQQLTPMAKNLPALWRMYKSFKQAPSADERPPSVSKSANNSSAPTSSRPAPKQTTSQPYTPRPSVPKIYQPTWP